MNPDVSTDMETGIELCAFLETAKKVSDIRISKYLRTCYKHVNYTLSTHSTSVQFLSKLIWIFSGSSLWDITADVMHCEEINPCFFTPLRISQQTSWLNEPKFIYKIYNYIVLQKILLFILKEAIDLWSLLDYSREKIKRKVTVVQ